MTLLLIDDDNSLRSQLKFSIETLFDEVYEAENKEDALFHINEKSFDVAVVDLHLENPYDGYEVAKTSIKENIKTIMFTANNNQADIKELIKLGVFDYLNKPVDIPTLKAAVRRAILFRKNEKKLAKDNIYYLNHCVDAKEGIKSSITNIEKDLFEKILKQNKFNIYHTAKSLNMKREHIYYFIKKYHLQREV